MEIPNLSKVITPFNFYTSPESQVYGQGLSAIIGITPGSSLTVHRRIEIVRRPEGYQRLEQIDFVYQLLRGVFTSVVPTLFLVKYNENDFNDYINIALTNTGYETTLGTTIIGTSTVNIPTYLTPTDGDYYLFDITFTIDPSDTGYVLMLGTNAIFSELTPYENINNLIKVDTTFGNDTTGIRTSNPFQTIGAALAVAQPGDVILIAPGLYNESVVIPDNITIKGMSSAITPTSGGVVIQRINVTEGTDLITMGENSKIENLTLYLHSTTHFQLRGIVLPGTTTLTAKIQQVNLIVDNSEAPLTGSSDVYGLHSLGTGTPTELTPVIVDSLITVRSVGGGTKRGILSSVAANNLYGRNVIINVTSNGIAPDPVPANSYIGVETNVAGAVVGMKLATINASPSVNINSADISQTTGTIILDDTNLVNATSNNLSFATNRQSQSILWADPTTLPLNSVNFYRPGTTPVSPTEITIRLSTQTVLKTLSVRAQTGPGLGNTNTWTIRRNQVNTGLTVSLTDTDTVNINNTTAVTFEAGDLLSLMVTTTAGSASDTIVQVDVY